MSFVPKFIKQKTQSNWGFYLIFSAIILGFFLYIGGHISDFFLTPLKTTNFWETILIGTGSLVLVSGISGAVIKILAVEGFFLDAVSESAFGLHGLERLKQNKLLDVWINSNNLLHLKGMNNKNLGDQEKAEIEELKATLSEQVRSNFESDPTHFVKDHDRTLKIEWENVDKQIIRITDSTRSVLIPFDPGAPLEWTVNMRSETGIPITEETVVDIEFRLIGDKKGSIEKQIEYSDDQLNRKTTFVSTPKPRHEIFRKREWRFSILNDPNLFTISPFYVRKSSARIQNSAEGLKIVCLWLGDKNLFEIIDGDKQINYQEIIEIRLKKQLLLPNQGYCLSFIKLH